MNNRSLGLFLMILISLITGCLPEQPVKHPAVFIREAEDYSAGAGVRIEEKPAASGRKCLHVGPDSGVPTDGLGDRVEYQLTIPADFTLAILEIYYTDDVGGNRFLVYLNDRVQGSFGAETTGGWNNFIMNRQKINLGSLRQGTYTLSFIMTQGGSWGTIFDYFKIFNAPTSDNPTLAYEYVKNLIQPNTGLVASAAYEKNYTTIYKNALASMVFIHQGNIGAAERIFDFFNSKYDPATFDGFNKKWNPETGNDEGMDIWEGDIAFLLLALNYYHQVHGSFGSYIALADGLVKWLASRADQDIIAEGLADMYAALKPYENTYPGMDSVLARLQDGFNSKKAFTNVLDHIERAALCFSDCSGFNSLNAFQRSEAWEYNTRETQLLSAFSWESFNNVEISAQILLAWKLRKPELTIDLSYLETELNSLWLFTGPTTETVTGGLPYFLSESDHGWAGCYDEPIIDTTCYYLFWVWGFNPMAPGY